MTVAAGIGVILLLVLLAGSVRLIWLRKHAGWLLLAIAAGGLLSSASRYLGAERELITTIGNGLFLFGLVVLVAINVREVRASARR